MKTHPGPRNRHVPTRVPCRALRAPIDPHHVRLHADRDPLGLLDLSRVGRHPPPAVHAPEDGRGRDDHDALPCCAWNLPSPVHPQLDLPVRTCSPFARDFVALKLIDSDIAVFHRYFSEDTVDPIAVVAGLVQTGLYIDFCSCICRAFLLDSETDCLLSVVDFALHSLHLLHQGPAWTEVRAPGINLKTTLLPRRSTNVLLPHRSNQNLYPIPQRTVGQRSLVGFGWGV